MKKLLVLALLLGSLGLTVQQQAERLQRRPTVLKLGPVANVGLLRAVAGEHAVALAYRTVVRVMFYFGSFFEGDNQRLQTRPEYLSMYNHIKNAVQLDPYNIDAYYFAEAAFTWEIGRVREVNSLLDHGMKFRTWDYHLPFYAGFNSAFFLGDYTRAAHYMQMAAERSQNPLFTNLAARYFHEAGQTAMGLAFLESMEKESQNDKVKDIYRLRKDALLAVNRIEKALSEFREQFGHAPGRLEDLVSKGIMESIPRDPYGGRFYLDEQNRVRSTSKFVMQSLETRPDVSPESRP